MFFAIPLKLRTKMFLSFAISTTFLCSCLSLWSYQTTFKTVRNEAYQVMVSAFEQDVRSINTSLAQIESTADLLCNDADVQRYFQQSFNTASEEYEQSVRMLRSTDSLLRGMARSVRLTMIGYHAELHEIVPFDFENRFSLASFSDAGMGTQGQVDTAVYRASRFSMEDWPADIRSNAKQQWVQTQGDVRNGTASLLQGLTVSRFSESAGAIKLTFSLHELLPGVNLQSGDAEYHTYVLNGGALMGASPDAAEQWQLAISSIPQLASNKSDATHQMDGLIAYTAHLNNGWQVTRIYEFEAMNRFSQITFQFITVLILSLLVTFGLSYIIANHFSSRIHAIGSVVSQFAQGQLNVRVPYQGDSDLDELALGFNKMAERIQSLIRDVYQTQILQQQQHLAMLQSQIRPHFLYNSLSAVVRLSERGDMPAIKSIAMALVRFYRISLSKGREQILFRDEVEHVRAYLEVCAIRYRDGFTCTVDIAPQCDLCYVPKIILQPFVENALEHGMLSDQLLHIRIKAIVHAGSLLITIQDDGVGLSAQMQAALSKDVQTSQNGYGIHNVRQRIQLTYGSGWGVRMHNVQPHGLCVTLAMPTQYKPTHSAVDSGQTDP